MRARVVWIFLLSMLLPGAARAAGSPLLILSGGGQPAQNGFNHLWNVRQVERFWTERFGGPVWSLVADGLDPAPDAAVAAPYGPEDGRWWLQVLVMRTDGALRFVNSTATSIVGSASDDGIRAWLNRATPQLRPGQTLTLYVTDHGVNDEAGRGILLWGDDVLSPGQLASVLRRLPRQVGVRLVMAQCYSGMFTETVAALLDEGRAACGFFAAPADRVAAGCRYDAALTGAAEYTRAMFGPRSRLRRQRDWLSAHLDAIAALPTVDVPIASSFVFGPPAGSVWKPHPRLNAALAGLKEPRQVAAPVPVTVHDTLLDRLDAAYDELEAALFMRWPALLYPFSDGRAPPEPAAVLAWVHDQPAWQDWRLARQALQHLGQKLAARERAEALRLRRAWLQRVRDGRFARRLPPDQWHRLQHCEGWAGATAHP